MAGPSHKRIAHALLDWFTANARDLPWRRTADPYAIWVSEIMLQQTQVKTVIPYWERWMAALPTVQALARAKPDRIHKLWEGLGYYTRVRNMQRAAQQILQEHGGQFPREFEQVLALPGIGRYTAGAVCSIAFDQPAPILDGNVIRVLARLFAIEGNPRDKQTNAQLWRLAESLVRATPECGKLNQALMELGALICTPRNPTCSRCPVRLTCLARKQARVGELPKLGKRVAATKRRFVAFVVENKASFLVRQRPPGVVNAHLWEFPNAEVNGDKDLEHLARRTLGVTPASLHPLCTINHTITRYRMTLDVYRAEIARLPGSDVGEWRRGRDLTRLAFSSAHKRIISKLLIPEPVAASCESAALRTQPLAALCRYAATNTFQFDQSCTGVQHSKTCRTFVVLKNARP